MSRGVAHRSGGFTLVEVLVAMGILAIGMSGIMALFSAGVALQREAVERMDMEVLLPGILAEVEEDLAARAQASSTAKVGDLHQKEFPVPGDPRYRYRVSIEDIPGDENARGFLCRVEVVARVRGQERYYDLGYLAIVPEENQDARIRKLPGR